ncbi:dynein light chain roadblock-type 1-like [Babylonia areolata]|uniref:dynein light chain roadblock-type 1-like n=1 Tax=Babylonia areolata TaxID=304850 RepID=UPI003FD3171E
MADVEETCKKIQNMKGVEGVLILNQEGIPIRSNMDKLDTIQIAALVRGLIDQACRVIKNLDNQNELTFLRLRTKRNEIMCAVDNSGYTMTVVQKAESC